MVRIRDAFAAQAPGSPEKVKMKTKPKARAPTRTVKAASFATRPLSDGNKTNKRIGSLAKRVFIPFFPPERWRPPSSQHLKRGSRTAWTLFQIAWGETPEHDWPEAPFRLPHEIWREMGVIEREPWRRLVLGGQENEMMFDVAVHEAEKERMVEVARLLRRREEEERGKVSIPAPLIDISPAPTPPVVQKTYNEAVKMEVKQESKLSIKLEGPSPERDHLPSAFAHNIRYMKDEYSPVPEDVLIKQISGVSNESIEAELNRAIFEILANTKATSLADLDDMKPNVGSFRLEREPDQWLREDSSRVDLRRWCPSGASPPPSASPSWPEPEIDHATLHEEYGLPTFGHTAFSGEVTVGLPFGFPIQDWTRYRSKLRVRFAVEDEIKLIPPNGNDGDGDGDGDVEMKEADARD